MPSRRQCRHQPRALPTPAARRTAWNGISLRRRQLSAKVLRRPRMSDVCASARRRRCHRSRNRVLSLSVAVPITCAMATKIPPLQKRQFGSRWPKPLTAISDLEKPAESVAQSPSRSVAQSPSQPVPAHRKSREATSGGQRAVLLWSQEKGPADLAAGPWFLS